MSYDPGVPAGTTYSPDYLRVGEDVSTTDTSTSDVAKEQAANVGQSAAGAGQHVAGVAKDEAANVGQSAADAGQHVAGVAKEQVTNVAAEAKTQAKDVLDQARTEAQQQAVTQQQRVVSGLRSIGDELGSMARNSEQSGVVTDLAHQASGRAHEIAGWLDGREPGDVLSEVRDFARRRPGAFLAIAAGAGLVAGRLTRGLTGSGDDSPATPATPPVTPAGYAPAPVTTTDPFFETPVQPAAPEVLTPEVGSPLSTDPLSTDPYVSPARYEGERP